MRRRAGSKLRACPTRSSEAPPCDQHSCKNTLMFHSLYYSSCSAIRLISWSAIVPTDLRLWIWWHITLLRFDHWSTITICCLTTHVCSCTHTGLSPRNSTIRWLYPLFQRQHDRIADAFGHVDHAQFCKHGFVLMTHSIVQRVHPCNWFLESHHDRTFFQGSAIGQR